MYLIAAYSPVKGGYSPISRLLYPTLCEAREACQRAYMSLSDPIELKVFDVDHEPGKSISERRSNG